VVIELAHREAGDGRALVLLHAFPLSSAMWLDQREALSCCCRVVTPDLRGFGGSELGEDEPSLDAVADDVAALLDRLELDGVVLGGLSMGGYVVMAFLRRHGQRVAGIVLADTKAAIDSAQGRATRERIAAAVLADPASTALVDEVLPTLLAASTLAGRPLIYGRIRALVQSAPPAAVAWALRAMAARPDSFGTLRGCPVPALVVVGEQDRRAPPSDAQAMADALPDAILVRIPEVGHLSAVEDPARFNRAVGEFLIRL